MFHRHLIAWDGACNLAGALCGVLVAVTGKDFFTKAGLELSPSYGLESAWRVCVVRGLTLEDRRKGFIVGAAMTPFLGADGLSKSCRG